MYLQLAESGVKYNPYLYVPSTDGGDGIYVREDYFDDLPHNDWMDVMLTIAPYQPQAMSEGLSGFIQNVRDRVNQRLDLMTANKQAKVDKKEAKVNLKNAKADAKTAMTPEEKAARTQGIFNTIGGVLDTAKAFVPGNMQVQPDGSKQYDGGDSWWDKTPLFGMKNSTLVPLGIGLAVVGTVAYKKMKKR